MLSTPSLISIARAAVEQRVRDAADTSARQTVGPYHYSLCRMRCRFPKHPRCHGYSAGPSTGERGPIAKSVPPSRQIVSGPRA
jgi:hypothetical protein